MRHGNYLRLARFTVQALCVAITVGGGIALVRDYGLPAPAFILLTALVGLFFCGWCCPFGTIQEWLRRLGKSSTGITLTIPYRVDRYLSYSRYFLLVVSLLFAVRLGGPKHDFLRWLGGADLETAAWLGVGIILALAMFTDRPFCKYVCSFGALYGLVSVFRVVTVSRNTQVCVDCGKCTSTCQMGVQVQKTERVRDPHCINCLECVHACPISGALTIAAALPRLADVYATRNKHSSKRKEAL